MPQIDIFFEALEQQYNNNLPFVVYSRPIDSVLKCWLQTNDEVYKTNTFSESGFVFAPFDLSEPAIIFPREHSNFFKIESTSEIECEFKSEFESKIESKQHHINLVSKGIEAIERGDFQKVVLSRFETQELSRNKPITIFKRLYNKYKNAMVYCWFHPKIGLWVGATPELLFKVEGQQLTTISLAGTQPFKPNSSPQWTKKEIEEQLIVTDFLAKKIRPFTTNTKISDIETVKAGNLWHLKTYLKSRLAKSSSLKTVIEALHPTPAVCGFPKDAAKAFILNNENYSREFYTGFLGELNLRQTKTRNTNKRNIENNAYAVIETQSNFYVNLRCMQIKNNTAIIYVGGGITKDSIPENEWGETCNKAKTIGSILN